MTFNEEGRDTLSRDEQEKKAFFPIFSTPSGMIISQREEQFLKAPLSIFLILSGRVREDRRMQSEKRFLSILANCPSSLICSKLLHEEKALFFKSLTDGGISILTKEEQRAKAYSDIVSKEDGSFTRSKLLHL